MSDFELFSKMLRKCEKNLVLNNETDYLSKRGISFDKVNKLGVATKNDFITLFVFDFKSGDFIEVIEERVSSDEKSFIKLLDSADIEHKKSNGTIDMYGEISETDDISISTIEGVAMKFLFGKSSQSLLGVVTEFSN